MKRTRVQQTLGLCCSQQFLGKSTKHKKAEEAFVKGFAAAHSEQNINENLWTAVKKEVSAGRQESE